MFYSYLFPMYRSPFFIQPLGYPGFGGYLGYNAIGSAIANQSMNVIGSGAIGGSQIATPTAIW